MKLLIETPTWLGDAVMATPAIDNLLKYFDDAQITLVGSKVSLEALKYHPMVSHTYVLENGYINLFKTIKSLGSYDMFVSFRGSIRSKCLVFCVSAKEKYQYDKSKYNYGHQVEKFNNFVCESIQLDRSPRGLSLHLKSQLKNNKKVLALSPGAAYGSAKRWIPRKFAEVAKELSNQYDILILGGNEEIDIAEDIENFLISYGIENYQNLVGKTSIKQLIYKISELDLFITGDSGPMHIAAAYRIPTVAIFGPTNDKETSQWMNLKGIIVKKNLKCQPCMKRICPLKHRDCMNHIHSSDVIKAIQSIT